MSTMFITLSMMISSIFMFMKHPLSMGFTLIIQTIMVSMITGLMINNFWFSYILMITMISGALVLFIYMASVASNEKFYTSITMLTWIMITMMIITAMVMIMEPFNIMEMTNSMNLSNNQVLSLIKLFNLHNMMITILIISYLFLIMIVISYIVNVFEGPLRTKN